jgi:MSHA biogenesis protein MshQ
VVINNATISSGSITANNVAISVSNSVVGSSTVGVNISGNNQVTLNSGSTVYGNVTAGSWSSALSIDNSSQVVGVCTPTNPRCNIPVTPCNPPSNIPSSVGVTCYCDNFTRSILNPSPIFGANWIVSTSDSTGVLPRIANSGYLRLTENTGANAKAATVPGIFPARGNYISVEFRHYAYSGSGADGIAVTLSDYSVPAVPGAFGGSLGYAQKSNPGSDCTKTGGCPGFAGGWLGVAVDEFGNFQNPSEGRLGGGGPVSQSVSVRGSGGGQTGYRFLAGTGSLSPQVDNSGSSTPSRGHYYQVVVDARNDPASTSVIVNRDTSGSGSSYSSLINIPNIYTQATNLGFTQSTVPANWQISFTGSTGGSTNIHEIGSLRICAQAFYPPSGGTASGFNAIDEDYGNPPGVAVQNYLNGHIYMKLLGTPFKLNVAALNNNQISTLYGTPAAKTAALKLVDNSDGACILDSSKNNYCSSACTAKSAVNACTSGSNLTASCSQNLSFGSSDGGQKQSADFTVNSAFKNLVALISDGTITACSTDAFSVRPTSVSQVTYDANNGTVSGDPKYKAGADTFTMMATIPGVGSVPAGYLGALKIDNTTLAPVAPATQPGLITAAVFSNATSGAGKSTATDSTFVYSEVGAFSLKGYNPAVDISSLRSVYDGTHTSSECASLTQAQCDVIRSATWSGIDSVSTMGDCILDSYSNGKTNGRYGCNFGMVADAGPVGRFIPNAFRVTEVDLSSCLGNSTNTAANIFPYMDQGIATSFRLQAINALGGVTRNYAGTLAKLVLDATASKLSLGAANAVPVFAALSSRLTAAGFSPTAWPNFSATSGEVVLSGNLALSSLNSPLDNRRAPDGPYADVRIGLAPVDSDGVRIATYDLDVDNVGGNDHFWLKTRLINSSYLPLTVQERFGRLRLSNVYGSATSNLMMPVEAQYWSGNAWVRNGEDSCTPLNSVTGAVTSLGNYRDQRGGTWTTTASGPANLSGGAGFLTVVAPGQGKAGSVDVCLDLASDHGAACAAPISLNLPYLQSRWPGGSDYNNDPTATATFGVFSPESKRGIYNRELF